MGAMLAPPRSRISRDRGTLLRQTDPDSQTVEVLKRRGMTLTVIDQIRLNETFPSMTRRGAGDGPVVLLLDQVPLLRTVTLPLAAESGLATLLRFEMDRLTPFAPSDVFWDWRTVRRNRAAGTLDIELVLMPRAPIDGLLASLADAGFAVTHLEAGARTGDPRRLPVAPPDQAAGHRRDRRRRAMYIVSAVLALACLVNPPLRQSIALRQVEIDIETIQPRVAEAQALRRRIADAATGGDVLAAARGQTTMALAALAALTNALPDGTWLTRVTLTRRRLTIDGQSAAAAGLIPALVNEPRLRDPAFTAPVVRGPNGREGFALRAELVP